MKQTAVEFLADNLDLKLDFFESKKLIKLFEQAKEMEKQQIIDSCDYGKIYNKRYDYDSDEYYNKTFNK